MGEIYSDIFCVIRSKTSQIIKKYAEPTKKCVQNMPDKIIVFPRKGDIT